MKIMVCLKVKTPWPAMKKESKKTQTKIPSMSNRSKLSDHFEDDE